MDKFVYNKIKAIQDNISKSVSGAGSGGNKGFPVGTIREWNGTKYKKKINGDWRELKKENKETKETTDEFTSSDQKAISNYTKGLYGEMNRYLRGVEGSDEGVKEDIDKLKTALSKLDSYSTNNDFLYRGVVQDKSMEEVKQEYENALSENNILEYDAFLSTSQSDDEVYDFLIGSGDKASVMFKINTKENSKGKNIQSYSAYPQEQEILFEDKSQFEVKSVSEEMMGQDNILMVELKEV